MAGILSTVGDIFGAAIGWAGDVAEVITATTEAGKLENPLLLLFAALPLCGIGIGFFKRLINVN